MTTMKDDRLISLNAAIDAMMKIQTEDIEAYGASIPEGFDGDRAVTAIKALPSAQPVNIAKLQPNCNQVASDCISRQAAIKTAHLPVIDDAGYEVVRVDDILALPSTQPGWIPTSVRLPEDNEEVLFCDNEGERWLGWHYGFWKTERLDFNEDEVVAWMPLPTPYREGGQS